MHVSSPRCMGMFALMGLGLLTSAHAAAPVAQKPSPAAHAAATGAPPTQASVPGLGASVGNSELATLNGGTSTYDTITLNGTVSNTTTTDAVTGLNEIGGGAFSNAVGFPMVIQNSGNSVLIQNATIINVQMQQ